MPPDTKKPSHLHLKSPPHDPNNPFEGDLFNRKELADKLTSFVERLPDGGVFAIDAPWGEGKTWFGRNWASYLKSEKFRTVFIDAFKHDYVEDPFLLVCSEILAEIKTKENGNFEKLVKAGVKVCKTLLPAVAKAGLNLALSMVGIADGGQKAFDAIEKGIGDTLEKKIAERFEEYEDEKKSVTAFVETLQGCVKEGEKPIVVIIDELDRCRPDFAVRLIERIKHFFDVPGFVFVLLLNRSHLEASVKGVYGQDVDSALYLGKFVHFFLRLPKNTNLGDGQNNHNAKYCFDLARRFGLSHTNGNFENTFGGLATLVGLSLRDLERGYTLFSLAQPINDSVEFIAWAITLKLAHPGVFTGIITGDRASHEDAAGILDKIQRANNGTMQIVHHLKFFEELHRWHVKFDDNALSEDNKKWINQIAGSRCMKSSSVLPSLFKWIDLSIR
jgi:hypothetical protein